MPQRVQLWGNVVATIQFGVAKRLVVDNAGGLSDLYSLQQQRMATTTSEFVLSVKLKPLPTDGPDAYQTATGASIGTMLGAVPFLVKL